MSGLGASAIFRASFNIVVSTSRADDRAGSLATLFGTGHMALSLPVLGLGIVLLYLSPKLTLLMFGLIVGLGILAATPTLLCHPDPHH